MSVIGNVLGSWAGRAAVGIAVVAVVGAVVVAPRIAASPAEAEIRTARVSRASITETILISGSVSAAGQLRLSFDRAGRLAELLVKVGDQVTAGQILARLGTADLELDVRQAEADLATARARYAQATSGATREEIAIARNSVETAIANYQDAERSTASGVAAAEADLERVEAEHATAKAKLTATLAALERALDDHLAGIETVHADALAVRDALEAIMRPGDITTARDEINEADLALTTAEEFLGAAVAPARADFDAARDELLAAIAAFDRAVAAGDGTLDEGQAFETALPTFDGAAAQLSTAVDAAAGELTSAQSSLTSARETLSSPDSLPLTLLAEERAQLATVQTTLLAEEQRAPAIKGVISQATTDAAALSAAVTGGHADARDAIDDAKRKAESTLLGQQNAIRSAELSLAKTAASPAQADIASAYAALLGAQVSLDRARQDLADATLTSPGAGVVAAISAQAGEMVSSAADPLITIAQTDRLTLEGTVGETEVARLQLDQTATVTVDAIGGAAMTGRVTAIDPVATIQQGVPVYGVDVAIDRPERAIRAGMSGTATVLVASRQDVLTVPNLAIRSLNGRRFVEVLRDGKAEPARVAFGISNDAVTEVTEGLQEGDAVVIPSARGTLTQEQILRRLGGGGQAPAGGARPPGR